MAVALPSISAKSFFPQYELLRAAGGTRQIQEWRSLIKIRYGNRTGAGGRETLVEVWAAVLEDVDGAADAGERAGVKLGGDDLA